MHKKINLVKPRNFGREYERTSRRKRKRNEVDCQYRLSRMTVDANTYFSECDSVRQVEASSTSTSTLPHLLVHIQKCTQPFFLLEQAHSTLLFASDPFSTWSELPQLYLEYAFILYLSFSSTTSRRVSSSRFSPFHPSFTVFSLIFDLQCFQKLEQSRHCFT